MTFDLAGLKYNENGLVPVVTQDATTGEVLMLAWANAEALSRSIDTGKATYWSRSRQSFWVKGESSGHTQMIKSIRVDCDVDAVLYIVDQIGPACHTNRRSCFYTDITDGTATEIMAPLKP